MPGSRPPIFNPPILSVAIYIKSLQDKGGRIKF
ncbi:MAG: hypothetical protein ACI81W_000518 [Saprospiraceae bacterium]